jgi:hypothetical protein
MKTKARIILLGQGEGIMKTKARIILLGLVMAIAFCYATSVKADSAFDTGSGATASVNLDFQIVIPSFIYFRVGAVGSVNTINFDPLPADVYTGTTIGGTGGDLGGGAVTVDLISNGGNITINTTNDGGGGGLNGPGILSYAQIHTGDGGNITAPDLTDGGALLPVVILSTVTNLSDTWTYTYENPATPPVPGTYTGRVTYTASIP